MSAVIEQMLKSYHVENIYDRKNAMKEIMQEIVLCGLSRAGFFKKAAFYGGTALRIFYGLDRFSEDLDFSLEAEELDFDLGSYFPVLEKEVKSFGLNVEIQEKAKTKESTIRSAFLKGSTKEHLLLFYADEKVAGSVSRHETVRIKFEVDVNPPAYATFEHKYRLLPVPYEVKMYDMPSLFAGKIHAVICRAWQSRIKGRDLYDYIFYLSRGAAVNQKHLRERLIDSKYITADADCSLNETKKMLAERFDSIDYVQARRDVEPFIHDTSVLDAWSSEFFRQITDRLTAI
ncbi:MAG: nucleotidyl transferase AbiEii/AbiGii toxin family protein [Candidatus Atribacteria bacterium]|nr:nucleotidyl transferase AbiEii/AbiGii toxin family protein [Candidatus Atribacteria bacterium]